MNKFLRDQAWTWLQERKRVGWAKERQRRAHQIQENLVGTLRFAHRDA